MSENPQIFLKALDHATTLNIPFVFSSNGDGFVFHDRTGLNRQKEANLSLDQFPTPKELWLKYCARKSITPDEGTVVLQDYYADRGGKEPRYYQRNAINAATEAIAKARSRSPCNGHGHREGWPCGREGACCPGLKCVFHGGSTRAGYACEP